MIKHLFATPGNPVRLVKPEDAAEASADSTTGVVAETVPQAALEVATNWWVMTPVVLVAIAAVLTIHLRIARRRRMTPEEDAFRRLAKAAKVPTKYRVLARRLADAKGAPPPVAVLLSDGALAHAAASIEAKPGGSTDKVLRAYLAERGVADPRPPAKSPSKPTDAKKSGFMRADKSKRNASTGTRVNTAA